MAAPDQPVPDPPQPPQVPNVDPKTFATIAAVVQAQVSQFISPLPDASILARYDQIVPGAAERILKLTEVQSAHRQRIESETLTAQIKESKRGQWIAAVISVLFLVGSVLVTLEGHNVVGTVLGGGTVATLVTAFIGSKRQQRTDLLQKRFGTDIVEKLKGSQRGP
jgi:uncharacterized membrane protein